jgi:hypothetical protein
MNKKKSGKKSIKITSKKAVHIMKKPSKSAVHIKPKSQKAHKKAVSQKIISKEAISKKPKETIRRQKKENAMQRRNEKKELSPAGHMLEIQKLEDELSSLKTLLKDKRKGGIDTFVDEMKLFTLPPKIQLLKIEFSEKTYSGVSSTLSEVRISLESAKPELIVQRGKPSSAFRGCKELRKGARQKKNLIFRNQGFIFKTVQKKRW